MSTKIYNAYYTTLNLENLLKKLIKLSPEFQEIKSDIYQQQLLNSVITEIDKTTYYKNKLVEQYPVLWQQAEKYKEQRKKWQAKEIDIENYSCSCIVYPLSANKTLILLFSRVPKMAEKFSKLSFLKNYEYFNNTDKPKNVTKKDWEQRLKDWDKVLGGDGYGVPLFCGYQFTLSDNTIQYYNWEKILNFQLSFPTLEERADVLIKQRIIVNSVDGNIWRKSVDQYNNYKKTKKYKTELNKIIKKLPKLTFNKYIK